MDHLKVGRGELSGLNMEKGDLQVVPGLFAEWNAVVRAVEEADAHWKILGLRHLAWFLHRNSKSHSGPISLGLYPFRL